MITRTVVLAMLAASLLSAQQRPFFFRPPAEGWHASGNLREDLLHRSEPDFLLDSASALKNVEEMKSPLVAGLYSAVLPGAGQMYTNRYWETAGFFGVEVAMWMLYAVYTTRGDRQTNDFQNYADANWSVVDYVNWMKKYFPSEAAGIAVNPDNSLRPWDRVDWSQVNAAEDAIGMKPTPTGFTHHLPQRPEQQYYELIGKYSQFGGGWNDAGYLTENDVLAANVSPNFLSYASTRGRANDLYRIASTASYVLVANHVLSALEAAWSAARFNARLKLEAHLEPTVRPFGFVEFVPTARMRLDF